MENQFQAVTGLQGLRYLRLRGCGNGVSRIKIVRAELTYLLGSVRTLLDELPVCITHDSGNPEDHRPLWGESNVSDVRSIRSWLHGDGKKLSRRPRKQLDRRGHKHGQTLEFLECDSRKPRQTAVPNNAPTPAVSPIASAPQKVTRTAALMTGAPPA